MEIVTTIDSFSAFASGSSGWEELMAGEHFHATGEVALLEEFMECLDNFEFGFEIVLP